MRSGGSGNAMGNCCRVDCSFWQVQGMFAAAVRAVEVHADVILGTAHPNPKIEGRGWMRGQARVGA